MNHEEDLAALIRALRESKSVEQRRIAEIGLAWIALILKKNQDYGGAVWLQPILCPDMSPKAAILVRMSDKIRRLQNLLTNGNADSVGESISDTVGDLGAYCLLWAAAPEEEA